MTTPLPERGGFETAKVEDNYLRGGYHPLQLKHD